MQQRLFFTLIMLYSFSSIQAADATHGKELVQQHCVRCHGTEPYTNENRTVKSLESLNQRVLMCAHAQELIWGNEEIADVVAYLNTEFYHFK